MYLVILKAKHFRTEANGDGLCGAVEAARSAVPAFIMILDHWKPLILVKMYHI